MSLQEEMKATMVNATNTSEMDLTTLASEPDMSGILDVICMKAGVKPETIYKLFGNVTPQTPQQQSNQPLLPNMQIPGTIVNVTLNQTQNGNTTTQQSVVTSFPSPVKRTSVKGKKVCAPRPPNPPRPPELDRMFDIHDILVNKHNLSIGEIHRRLETIKKHCKRWYTSCSGLPYKECFSHIFNSNGWYWCPITCKHYPWIARNRIPRLTEAFEFVLEMTETKCFGKGKSPRTKKATSVPPVPASAAAPAQAPVPLFDKDMNTAMIWLNANIGALRKKHNLSTKDLVIYLMDYADKEGYTIVSANIIAQLCSKNATGLQRRGTGSCRICSPNRVKELADMAQQMLKSLNKINQKSRSK